MSENVKVSNTSTQPRQLITDKGPVTIGPGQTVECSLGENEHNALVRESKDDSFRKRGGLLVADAQSKEVKTARERVQADVKKDQAERVKEERAQAREEAHPHRQRARE